MKAIRAIVMAFAMYSRLPMPMIQWTAESRSWALCALPLVGVVVGAALFLWSIISAWLQLGAVLRGAGFMLIPLLITGGIHMDGFCDVCDARSSHQEREKKLEILSDPRVGAFAVMGCICYLMADFALWCEFDSSRMSDMIALSLFPILSRTMSAYAATTQPNARGGGLLAAFTEGPARPRRRLLICIGSLTAVLISLSGLGGVGVIAAVCVYFWYLRMAHREFGGLTGDLAGWFLQMCELAGLGALVLAQRIAEVLL